ncbi:MAG TPA: hypothetical protein VMU11_03825 [Verrucomicrobiae bacterium]|nr:hypothetical protein [Verrucomicrobiae bacterium]
MKNFLMLAFAVVSMMASGCGMGVYGTLAGVPYSTGGYGTPTTFGGASPVGVVGSSCGANAPCATFYAMNEYAATVTVQQGPSSIAQFTLAPYSSRVSIPVSAWAQYTYTVQCMDSRGGISPHVYSSPMMTGGARIDLVPMMCN